MLNIYSTILSGLSWSKEQRPVSLTHHPNSLLLPQSSFCHLLSFCVNESNQRIKVQNPCNVLAWSVQFSCSVVPSSLRPHGLQDVGPPYPSPTPGACSNSCPTSWWCHPTISLHFPLKRMFIHLSKSYLLFKAPSDCCLLPEAFP